MIVDTNALSSWRDSDPALLELIANSATLALPVIALGEFGYGLTRSTQQVEGEMWLDRLIQMFRVLPVTLDTAKVYAKVRSTLQQKGRPIPANDMWIAALAIQHGLPLLSRDTHFDVVDGVKRIGW